MKLRQQNIIATLTFLFFFLLPITQGVFALCPDLNDPSCPEFQAIKPPSSWLNNLPVGIPIPSGGLSYITGNVVPFVMNLLVLLVIVLSLIFLIWGAVMWMASSGAKEPLAKAKATVTYALIGLILGITSYIIISLVSNLIGINLIPNNTIPSSCYASHTGCPPGFNP